VRRNRPERCSAATLRTSRCATGALSAASRPPGWRSGEAKRCGPPPTQGPTRVAMDMSAVMSQRHLYRPQPPKTHTRTTAREHASNGKGYRKQVFHTWRWRHGSLEGLQPNGCSAVLQGKPALPRDRLTLSCALANRLPHIYHCWADSSCLQPWGWH
jgi:hypothetical protein